jgi:hypothetical protein
MAIHPGSIWMDQNWTSLSPGLWVATNASGVVAEDSDYDQMVATVRRLGISLSDVTIVLVPIGVIQ